MIHPAHLTRRIAQLACAFLLVAATVATVCAPRASAYNGEFCYGIYLNIGNTCRSSYVTHIRRAISHSDEWTFVQIFDNSINRNSACYSDGCTADTGYLSSDINGYGGNQNIGDAAAYYYGWLYP